MPKPFMFYTDPGHAWLKVSSQDLLDVELSPANFSSFSYRKDGNFYLEEDLDAARFIWAWEDKNDSKIPLKRSRRNTPSPIRDYERISEEYCRGWNAGIALAKTFENNS